MFFCRGVSKNYSDTDTTITNAITKNIRKGVGVACTDSFSLCGSKARLRDPKF